ncbi:MAG: hypothetical protein ACE5G1_07815 [bacterium]
MKRLSLFSILLWGTISILTLSAVSDAAYAQSARTDHNSVYLELLGNGVFFSINYDRMFSESLCGRVGFSYAELDDEKGDNVFVTFVPVVANYLVGKGKHKLELGLGALFIFAARDFDETDTDVDKSGILGTATVGYRFQPLNGGFVFRVGFTPIFADDGFAPWGGLSFGYGF